MAREVGSASYPSKRVLWAKAAEAAHEQLTSLIKAPSPPGRVHGRVKALAAANHRLFDMTDLEYAVRELEAQTGESKDSLQKAYTALRCVGPWRPLAPAPAASCLDQLRDCFPNFNPVIGWIDAQMALSRLGTLRAAHFPPILLVGDPGVGKTAFASQLAGAIGTGFEEISLPGASASFTICGMSSGWAGGKAGRIFQSLAWGGTANPIVLLDEIDKAGGDHRFDVGNSLLPLLERHSAIRFIDEFIELPIDASRILWIATANDLESISRPLLSRMQVFHISAPDAQQGRRIARSVYTSMRASSDWGHRFPAELTDEVADLLSGMPPRAQRQALIHAIGQAARRGSSHLHPGDLHVAIRPARRIGF